MTGAITIWDQIDFDWLAEAAAFFLARRRRRYPSAIERGKITAGQADRDLAAWEAIAADWKFATALAGIPGDQISIAEKCAAFERAIERAAIAAARHPETFGYALEREICKDMLHRYQRPITPPELARMTIQMRDDHKVKTTKAA